jgi:hypothetical protein
MGEEHIIESWAAREVVDFTGPSNRELTDQRQIIRNECALLDRQLRVVAAWDLIKRLAVHIVLTDPIKQGDKLRILGLDHVPPAWRRRTFPDDRSDFPKEDLCAPRGLASRRVKQMSDAC